MNHTTLPNGGLLVPCQKIDTHMHLSLPGQTGGIPAATPAEMLPHMQQFGIRKALLMSCGETPGIIPGGDNAACCAIARQDPEHFAWACNLDFQDAGTVEQRLVRYKEQGAVGIGEFMINRPVEDPFLQAVYAAAGRLGLPVTFHFFPTVGGGYGVVDEPGLPGLERMLAAYPHTVFVGHSSPFWAEISGDAPREPSRRNAWGAGPVLPGGRLPYLLSRYPNLYADLSANSGGCAILRDPDFGLRFLHEFADKLLFATDMTAPEQRFPLGPWLDEQAACGALPLCDYEKICFRNARRLYGFA